MKLPPKLRAGIAITTIAICGIIELLFVGVLVTAFLNEKATITEKISPLFAMCIFAFPIWWGLSIWKSAKIKEIVPSENSVTLRPDASIKVDGAITLSDYRKIVFQMTYSMPVFIFIHVIGVFLMVTFLSQGSWNWYTGIFFFLLILPVAVLRAATKQYESAKMLHEGVNYTFTEENILCEGKTFNSTVKWEGLFKAKETKDFFLLYANTSSAMFIPKRAFASEGDLNWFRTKVRHIG